MTDPSSAPPPRFLADRCLGKVTVERLRRLGWDIVRLGDVTDDDAQEVSDEALVELAGRRGWAILTKDKRIRYQPSFALAVTPLFTLSSGEMSLDEAVACFEAARHRIWAAARAPEKQFWVVYGEGRCIRRA